MKEECGSLKEANRSLKKERDTYKDEYEVTEKEVGNLHEVIKSLKSKKIEEVIWRDDWKMNIDIACRLL